VEADQLGIGKAALVTQVNRLERELGTTLLVRAERGRAMQRCPRRRGDRDV